MRFGMVGGLETRSALITVVMLSALIVDARCACAQTYGRDVASGDWASGWVDQSGGTSGVPGASDYAYIGSAGYPFASALSVATVSLDDNRQVNALGLGVYGGDAGTINIQSTGSLTVNDLSIATGGDGNLSIAPGGTMTVVNSLSAGSSTGSATIDLNGETVSVGSYNQAGPVTINRGSGGGIQGSSYSIGGATTYTIEGADSFTDYGSVYGGATVTSSTAQSLSSALDVSGAGSTYTANADLAVGNYLSVFDGAQFDANADVSAGGYVTVYYSGILNLNSGTLTTPSLQAYLGGTINQNGGAYDVASVNLSDGASLDYQVADNITEGVQVYSGASFSLDKDLVLGGGLNADNATINLNGHQAAVSSLSLANGATINRGAGGGIQGSGYSIGGATTYTIEGADSFTDYGSVYGGATVTSSTAQSLSSALDVSGAGSTYTANADLAVGNYLSVFDGAQFDANADVSAGGYVTVYYSGILNLNSGTLTTPSLQVYSGGEVNASANVSVSSSVYVSDARLIKNGGNFTAGQLVVVNNGVVQTNPGMTVNGFLQIGYAEGDFGTVEVVQSTGDSNGLSLEEEFSNLIIAPDATLSLAFDSETGNPLDWAFRWKGEHVEELLGLWGTRIIVEADDPVGVIRAGDFTYIGQIPYLRGDYNDDGRVDAGDYIVYRKFAGTTYPLPNDPFGGMVGIDQYNTWLENFGNVYIVVNSNGAAAQAPEPCSWVVVLISMAAAAPFLRGRKPDA